MPASERAATGTSAPGRELRARGRETMQRLLDAGAEVFARRGYHSVRVDDIVKVAKTSHGTFYLYFANKEALFRRLAEHVAGEMRALAESLPAITPDRAGYTAIRDWLTRFSEVHERYGPVIRAWTEAETGSGEFSRLGTGVLAEFTGVLAGRIREAGAPGLDPDVASVAFVAMIERFHYYMLARDVQVAPATAVETLATVVHSGLFGAARLPAATR